MLMPCAIGLVRNSSLKELNLNGNRYAVFSHLTAIVPMFSFGSGISLTGWKFGRLRDKSMSYLAATLVDDKNNLIKALGANRLLCSFGAYFPAPF